MKQFLDVLYKIASKIKYKQEAIKNLNFLKQYEEVTNSSALVSKTDTKGIITYANESFCKLSGYSKDELIGKNVVFVANLKPRKLRGVMSEGMLLAADDGDGIVSLLTFEKDMPSGSQVR